MLDGLAPALAFGFIAGVMPGPLQTFLLLQSLDIYQTLSTGKQIVDHR